MARSLNELLVQLTYRGAYPSLYYRGKGIWRAHINRAGTRWADADTPFAALKEAEKLWRRDGCPMDGAAVL